MSWTAQSDLLAASRRLQRRRLHKASASAEGAGTYHSLWRVAGDPGAGTVPAAGGAGGEIPIRTTLGGLALLNPSGDRVQRVLRWRGHKTSTGVLVIYDRLWACSGFSLNATTPQAVVGAPALTRPDALGAGAELWGEVYSAGGAGAATLTASYTASDGTPGRVATYVQPANALSVGQMVRFELQGADWGLRSVESLTLDVGTGTAGDFGLTILRPLAAIPFPVANSPGGFGSLDLELADLPSGACLALQMLCTATNSGLVVGEIEAGDA
ncbi:MAG: hypothetical protein KJ067_25210 [Vicinamibacteria bacterium]|nr:hypothetical protein [Vicinamibacteria bacterium]